MSNLNWPEGATHYIQAGEEHTRFRDLSGEQWKYFNSYTGEWVQHYFSSEDLLRRHDLIARPQPKPWSGPEDGLPPVGTVCEHSFESAEWDSHDGEWFKVEIIAHHRFQEDDYVCAVWVRDAQISYSSAGDHFRALKDPEQQAAEKRESAIRELMDIAQVDCRVTAARLVDAGFKREVV